MQSRDVPVFTGERVLPDRPEIGELFREHLVRYQFASQFCKGQVILDAGCGVGYGTDLLRRAGASQAFGVDISLEAISYARQRYGSTSTHFAVADCADLPFANDTFDLLVSFETIEHLTDARSFLAEVQRVLTTGGLAIISTPNRLTYPKGNPFHVHEYDKAEFVALLQDFFPHVDLWQQDLSTIHRIAPEPTGFKTNSGPQPHQLLGSLDLAPGCVTEPAYFIAVCALERWSISPPQTVILASERDLVGDLARAQRWANGLDEEIAQRDQAIRSLQDQIRALEATVDERTAWARERDAETVRLGEIIRSLQDQIRALEATVDERTAWARERDAETVRLGEIIRSLRDQLATTRQIASTRWVRLGQALRLVPRFSDSKGTQR